jgi:hypothetical protein
MKHPIKSIFEQISEQVFRMTNLSEAQAFVIDFVNSKNINDKDKKHIVYETKNAKSLVRFQTYICNSLLKYEGMSVNFNKETTI